MKDITVGIKTFLRPEVLICCLEALRKFDFKEVIIADDNPDTVTEAYAEVYSKYRTLLPLRVLKLPFNTGLAASRNHIVAVTQTDFLLMLDDDQVVNKTLPLMYDVLKSNAQIGGVSCFFNEKNGTRCAACDIYIEDAHIVKELRRTPDVHITKQGTRYSVFEFIPSATLFRLPCLQGVPWDPFYKIGAEHLDFYLRQKQLNKWEFAVALDASISHEVHNTADYMSHRMGIQLHTSWEYFNTKFNVQGKIEGKKYSDVLNTGPVETLLIKS